MASIRERNGKFTVDIRMKNFQLHATFDDRQTAELWAYYKQKIADEIKKFDVPLKDLFTLRDAVEIKLEILARENPYHKSLKDIKYLESVFDDFIDEPIQKLTYENLIDKAKRMMNATVRKGGNQKKKEGGVLSQQSPATVIRKFRCLGSVISEVQKLNFSIDNAANRICNELKRAEYENGKNAQYS